MPAHTVPRKRRTPSRLWRRAEYDSRSTTVAAKHLPLVVGINYLTAWRLMQKGAFPRPIQLSPGRIAWIRTDLDRWLAEKRLAS